MGFVDEPITLYDAAMPGLQPAPRPAKVTAHPLEEIMRAGVENVRTPRASSTRTPPGVKLVLPQTLIDAKNLADALKSKVISAAESSDSSGSDADSFGSDAEPGVVGDEGFQINFMTL